MTVQWCVPPCTHRYIWFSLPLLVQLMFYLSLSEGDIFSVKTAHVSEKEEQHCFCKQRNISGIPRGSETGGHPAASDAQHTVCKTCIEKIQGIFSTCILNKIPFFSCNVKQVGMIL